MIALSGRVTPPGPETPLVVQGGREGSYATLTLPLSTLHPNT